MVYLFFNGGGGRRHGGHGGGGGGGGGVPPGAPRGAPGPPGSSAGNFTTVGNITATINMNVHLPGTFGTLSSAETKHALERTLHHVLCKCALLGCLSTAPTLGAVVVWMLWFTAVGFLKLVSGLAYDRFEALHQQHPTFMPTNAEAPRVKQQLVRLLITVLIVNGALSSIAASVWPTMGASTSLLLLFDNAMVLLDTAQALVHCSLALWEDTQTTDVVESRRRYVRYVDLSADAGAAALTCMHYFHLWLLRGVGLQLFDVVLLVHLRSLIVSLKETVHKYRSFQRALNASVCYPEATEEELQKYDDLCAICREPLPTVAGGGAKKLPVCGHIFHGGCLRLWIEHQQQSSRASADQTRGQPRPAVNASCPVCRAPVEVQAADPQPPAPAVVPAAQVVMDDRAVRGNETAADENNIVSAITLAANALAWMSQGAMHPGEHVGGHHHNHTREMDTMVARVREVLPHVQHELVVADLMRTRDPALTINRLLEML